MSNSRLHVPLPLLCYTLIVGCTLFRHEPWADEAQAWLLARDSGLRDLWTRLLHYEGTPGLWHTILHVLISLRFPYAALGVISAIAGCAATWLLLARSPFPLAVRLLLPFTYYLCYQYAVIARSYSLVPVLLFAAAWLFRTALDRLLLFIAILCALALTSVHALALSLAIAVALLPVLFRRWTALHPSVRTNVLVAAAGYLSAVILAIGSAWPAHDVAFPFHAELTLARAVGVTQVVLAQAFTGHWILSIVVIAMSVPFLWRGRGLLLFTLATVSMCGLSVVVYWNAWSQGLLFLGWVIALWIAAQNTPVTRTATAAVLIVCACQCHWTIRSCAYDLQYPYSGSREAAQYLQTAKLTPAQLYGIGYSVTALQPYFPHNMFGNLNNGTAPAFWDWSNRNSAMDPAPAIALRKPDYVLAGFKVTAEKLAAEKALLATGYAPVRHFDGHLFWRTAILEAESYDLYKLSFPSPDVPLLSQVTLSDPASARQLVRGFYGLEANSWRWTARSFSIAFQPPPTASATGARLELRLTVPATQIDKLGPITLAAKLANRALPPQTFTTPGAYTYTRDIPPDLLRATVVTVDFTLDKSVPPSASDARELGIILASAGLYRR